MTMQHSTAPVPAGPVLGPGRFSILACQSCKFGSTYRSLTLQRTKVSTNTRLLSGPRDRDTPSPPRRNLGGAHMMGDWF